ncbi:hypothetical protein H7I77_25330 [Mycolicibacterium novocastrense]|uniref:ABC-type spermidine/putrescine transport system, ATPase component n=1 Tax=Mycolicibacterium novocastrense TaxID=59813 RepID=A0AAW5SR41_MYCNV|nr:MULTISPECIES: hypothetical protein [Mycolicibacterium]MCV7026633.1 hypothetical protein [Mycolicibacterium novocastrense]MDX1887505.1 hypothetical protein [Mycolicibacterium sp. 120270]GAT07614.1 ABC-type spermidine/putrescine transport system, ATPase component [Mycolicibacterium novocastrense]
MAGDEFDVYCADLAARVSAGDLSFDAAVERARWARFDYDAFIDALAADVADGRRSMADAHATNARTGMIAANLSVRVRLNPSGFRH